MAISEAALEHFLAYNKKSLLAGVITGQSMKGRGGVPQDLTPPTVPAGFPQGAWEEANQAAALKIAELMDARTPASPASGTRPFDAEAFCFGLAVGRTLEGWELDGAVNLPAGWAKIMYYVRVKPKPAPNEKNVSVYIPLTINGNTRSDSVKSWNVYVSWREGAGFSKETVRFGNYYSDSAELTLSHSYGIGLDGAWGGDDFIITVISDQPVILGADEDRAIDVTYNLNLFYAINDTGEARYPNANDFEAVEINLPQYDNYDAFNRKAIYTRTQDGVVEHPTYPLNTTLNSSLLQAAHIEGDVTLSSAAFFHCLNLTSVTANIVCAGGKRRLSAFTGQTVGFLAFAFCPALTDVDISGIARIGQCAFEGCENLAEITFQNGVRFVSYQFSDVGLTLFGASYAFAKCKSLTTVHNVPIGIPEQTFACCPSLQSIAVSDGTPLIGRYAFFKCYNLTDVTLPESVTEIESGAFRNCYALLDFALPSRLSALGDSAFCNCRSLTHMRVPPTCQRMGSLWDDGTYGITVYNSVSSARSTREIDLGGAYVSIGWTFAGCYNLETVELPPAFDTMAVLEDTFQDCHKLRHVSIPDNVKVLEYAFWKCYALQSVRIPASLDYIGFGSFYGCNALTDIYYAGTQEQWNAITKFASNDPLYSATIHYESA